MKTVTKHKIKPRLLLVGDYQEGTGFHRVTTQFKRAAIRHFEIHHVGFGYSGEIFSEENGTVVYPAKEGAGGYGGHKYIGRLLKKIEPDVFFIIYDFAFIRFILEALRYKTKPLRTGIYLALDGLIQNRRKMIAPLKAADLVVFYNEFSLNQVTQLLREQPSLLRKQVRFTAVPHGVETELFYPLVNGPAGGPDKETRAQLKQRVFPALLHSEDSFIVFNGNRPTARKQLGVTLTAFALFAEGKGPEVRLYLHFLPDKDDKQNHLNQLIEQLGIADRIIYRKSMSGGLIVDNSTLNQIYNACDVGINTAMGEGWGLVSCEHAATGVPQILPRHTSFTEIWSDAALLVEPTGPMSVTFSSHLMYETSPERFAEALETMYRDRTLRDRLANAGYRRMQEEQYKWDHITRKWEELLLALHPPQIFKPSSCKEEAIV